MLSVYKMYGFKKIGRLISVVIMPFLFSCKSADDKLVVVNKSISIKGISLVAPVNKIGDEPFIALNNLHVNTVALMPYAFCSNNDVKIKFNYGRQWWGEKDDGIIECIRLAKQANLSVFLKPHLWISHGEFTGDFAPADEAGWQLFENSYSDYILHNAAIADSMQVEIYCIGIELKTFVNQRPSFWNKLIEDVRKVYKGKLTYAANWDEFDKVSFWNKLDFIGIDAYFPLVNEKSATKQAIQNAWGVYEQKMNEVAVRFNKKILFTEFGYRSADYATHEPWKEESKVINELLQANAIDALFETFSSKEWFAGGFIWKWFTDRKWPDRKNPDFTPQGKLAEEVIAKWYSR